MGIPLRRNASGEWPDDAPPGTFDVTPSTMAGRPAVSGHLIFVCPNKRRCTLLVGPAFENRRNDTEPCVWGWNGNEDKPTLTPSINCISEKDGKPTGGCGWHGWMQGGELSTA